MKTQSQKILSRLRKLVINTLKTRRYSEIKVRLIGLYRLLKDL